MMKTALALCIVVLIAPARGNTAGRQHGGSVGVGVAAGRCALDPHPGTETTGSWGDVLGSAGGMEQVLAGTKAALQQRLDELKTRAGLGQVRSRAL